MNIWQHLFSGRGRIRRRNYWLYVIATWLVASTVFIALTLQFSVFIHTEEASSVVWWPSLVYLVAFWISACLQIKRWHDRDKSGWWILINFLPLIGGIWALVETGFLDGTRGTNQFGPSPKHNGQQANLITASE
jgi:uncharacterized membrane protein YhaH (DUF805 family)